MLGELHAIMINRDVRKSREGVNPGCSAQSRWTADRLCDDFRESAKESCVIGNRDTDKRLILDARGILPIE